MTERSFNRRQLLLGASVSAFGALSRPSFAETSDAPPSPALTFVYESLVLLSPDVPHGHTPRGDRFRAPIIGGDARGPMISGRVVPGGADWQLLRTDHWFELDAEYYVETHDGAQIRVRNHGLWHSPSGDWPADYAYTTPEFEAPDGPYSWLNQHVFVGTVGPGPDSRPAVTIRIWRVG